MYKKGFTTLVSFFQCAAYKYQKDGPQHQKLKQELQRFLLDKSFYSVKEYFDYEME